MRLRHNCRLRRFIAVVMLALAAMLTWTTNASAQTGELNSTEFQLERFEPLPAQGTNILNVAKSDVLPHIQPSAGVFFHYVNDPLRLVDAQDEDEVIDTLVSDQFKAEFWGGVGLHDIFDIGFVLPVVFYQAGDDLDLFGDPESSIEGAALSDLRLVPKARIVDPDWAGGFGLSALATLTLPTGDTETFNSDGSVRFEPRLAADWRHPVGLVIAANLAYSFRDETRARNFVADDVIRYSLGVEAPTGIENFQVIGSFFGDVSFIDHENLADPLQGSDDENADPIELLGGVQYHFPYNLVANAGAGSGLNRGVGSPDFRVFLSVGYTPTASDTDQDGIYDADDNCPREPEDKDGFEDSDGCPDHDNDQDGILDVDDECPDQPEDMDGFKDEDGCPDPDNDDDGILDGPDECPDVPGPEEHQGCPELDKDGDGLLDAEDDCPEEPEDKDGFEDDDGCPDPDNDQDGILDDDDECPDEPEDMDGLGDEDGCPEKDFDEDGIPDEDDECPSEPETINGIDDEDGCPDKGESKVRVTKTRIEILEKVYFETAKASIKERSFNVLNQVASVLKANPQITLLRVEGHTDSRGSDSYNLELSQRRAKSVKAYLTAQGVDEKRLLAKGFGETKPVANNNSASGREKNRRVEFLIVEINGEPVEAKGAVIEKTETVAPGDGEEETEEAEDGETSEDKTEEKKEEKTDE